MSLPLPLDSGLIQEFNVGPLTLERRSAPVQNARGGFDDGTLTTLSLNPVAAHTVDGRDLLQVPEADRTNEVVAFYTTTPLRTSEASAAPDVITYRGRKFRAVRVMDYQLQGGVFITLATLLEGQLS